MSAPSPRPSAFRGIGNDLLGELRVAFCALAMNIVENDRFSETWRFRQAHIARNYAFEDLCAEECAQVRCDLPGKRGSLVVHRKQDPLNFQTGIERAPDAYQGIQKLRDTFQSQVFTLDGNEHGIRGYKRVQREEVQSGRTVQDDIAILFLQGLQRGLELILAVFCTDEFYGGSRK